MRRHWQLSEPLFARRKALIPRIPHFWSLVFDEAPPEIENYIQPSDSRFFAEYLKHFEVDRFELDDEPRSFTLRFEFGENPHFEETVVEKKFWFRRSLDDWSGYVSQPVAIKWKQGKDLTNGLTDATCKLWAKWKQLGGEEKRKGFSIMQDDDTYTSLKDKLEHSDFRTHSFFTLFTHVSTHRYVSAEESIEATKKENERRAARSAGKPVAEDEDEAESDPRVDDSDVTACPHGEDLATVLVEELYNNAVKYFSEWGVKFKD